MRIAAALALSLMLAGLPATQIDVTKLGPPPGQPAPDFQLADQQGKTRTLASVAGPKGTMLVFVRSAASSPYCRTQLLQLQRNLAVVTREGYGLAAVSADSPATLRAFAGQHGLTFPLLSDAGSRTISAWGLLDRSASAAHPGTFIIAPDRRILYRAAEPAYQERSTAPSVLARLGAPLAPAASASAAAPHLALRSGASDAIAAPGDRITLMVDATPGPKIHVYSPEQKNYIPVALKLDASADVRLHPVQFPPSGTYFYAPLNETVRVYSKPFRVIQDVTVALTPALQKRAAAKQPLTVTGMFEYQACDDAVCYRPESVPLRWTVTLTPLAR
jgi:peroxiredoxin